MKKALKLWVGLIVMMTLFSIKSSLIYGTEIEFTEEELLYIKENPVVTIGIDSEFAPYEFIDKDGLYKGIAKDYLEIIESRTGLIFEPSKQVTWTTTYEMALEGAIDVLPIIGVSDERRGDFLFTQSYLNYQRVLLTNTNHGYMKFNDLDQSRVGVQRNTSHYSYFISNYTSEPIVYENFEALLEGLATNDIDVAIANLAMSKYQIKQMGISNIRIDDIDDQETTQLAMGITRNNDVLLGIIDKALATITQEEKVNVLNDWLGIEQAPNYDPFIKGVLIGLAIMLTILTVIIYWNSRLKKEIRQREILEKSLEDAKNEAEKANESKSMFLAHMAHEIRTPLNAITGLLYLLEKCCTSTTQRKYFDSLQDASDNLMTVITDILDFSKIEAGKLVINKDVFKIEKMMRQIRSIILPKVMDKDLKLHMYIDPDLPEEILGDGVRLQQILMNLISNAVKFTLKGTIDLRIEKDLEEEGWWKFTIMDTGIGIGEDDLNLLFSPFHQVDNSLTRAYGGTGLGLNIANELTHHMGGHLNISSKPGDGSTFILRLPYGKSYRENAIQLPSYLIDKKVLILENDLTEAESIMCYLDAMQVSYQWISEASAFKEGFIYNNDLVLISADFGPNYSNECINKIAGFGKPCILMTFDIGQGGMTASNTASLKDLLLKPVLFNELELCLKHGLGYDVAEMLAEHYKIGVGHTLLLVEDNPVNQAIAREILEKAGYSVRVADNGADAIEIVKHSKKIELILMDLNMPIVDGYKATETIRAIGIKKPILALTAVSFSSVKKQCEFVGMDGFIAKPINPRQMLDVIDYHLKVQTSVSAAIPENEGINHRLQRYNRNHILNEKLGIRRIGNDTMRYYEILQMYYEEIEIISGKFAENLVPENYEAAIQCVHKLKGNSGNIGAIKIFESSSLLEKALIKGDQKAIEDYKDEFLNDLATTKGIVLELLEAYHHLQRPVAEKNKALEDIYSGPILYHLMDLLDQADLDAFKIVTTLDSNFVDHRQWNEMKTHMQRYEFEQAKTVLVALLQ